MIILTVLILLVPALIGVLLYERFKGYELIWRKRVELLLVFAFLLNLGAYTFFWLRGWGTLLWTLSYPTHLGDTGFVAQYMAFTLVAAVALAYVSCLVRVSKAEKREDTAEADELADDEEATEDKTEDKAEVKTDE